MFGQPYNVYQQPIYNQPQMMQEPMMRPQYQLPQSPQGTGQTIIWVPNERAANDYIVAPNNAVTLWDMNSPVVYVKKADASGKPAMTIYDLVERAASPATPTASAGEYVTRREFEELTAKVTAIIAKSGNTKEASNEPIV